MRPHLLFLSLSTILAITLLSGCVIVANVSDEDANMPSGSHLVASGGDDKNPLLFIAPTNGQVMFYSNTHLLATFPVEKGDRVELNNPPPATGTGTQVTINGKSVYASPDSPAHTKLYFKPGSNTAAASATAPADVAAAPAK